MCHAENKRDGNISHRKESCRGFSNVAEGNQINRYHFKSLSIGVRGGMVRRKGGLGAGGE